MSASADGGSSVQLDCGHLALLENISQDHVECTLCDQRTMPTAVRPGRRTPTFSAQTVPAALLAAHRTAVWAKLVVTQGTVEFVDEDPPWRTVADPDAPVVIVPERRHSIAPSPDAEFFVQFYLAEP